MKVEIIDALNQPEYTGKNRCEPCTVLNVVLASLLSSTIARKSRLGGYMTFILSLGLIYFRGYLVPGTPELTKQYLPPEVLRWFGKEPQLEARSGLDGTFDPNNADKSSPEISVTNSPEANEIDPHDYLLAEGILEPCEDQNDLCLVDDFRMEWNGNIAKLADVNIDTSEAVSALGIEADTEEFEIEQYGDAWTLVAESRTIGQWPSQGALLADIGAAHVLNERSEHWDVLTPTQRGQILNGLRLFLEQCPNGAGSVSMNQETVESCCSSHEVISITCDETGDRLFEQQVTDVDTV